MNYSTTHHLYRLQAPADSQTLAVDPRKRVRIYMHIVRSHIGRKVSSLAGTFTRSWPVQGFSHWMAQFYLESSRQKEHEDKLVALLLTILNSSLPVLSQEVTSLYEDETGEWDFHFFFVGVCRLRSVFTRPPRASSHRSQKRCDRTIFSISSPCNVRWETSSADKWTDCHTRLVQYD